MNKLIISTVGTSLATNVLKKITNPDKYRKRMFSRIGWNVPIDDLHVVIDDYLKASKQEYLTEACRAQLSAELNSLNALKIDKADSLIFIATDTAQSRFICQILKDIIIEVYGTSENDIRIIRIEGLQVHDSKMVRTQGFKNLIKEVQQILVSNRYQYADTVLNITGGFKGVVPFMTVMGMLYKVKTVYLFETSTDLITLPPLPFSFDLELFERVKPALEYIEQEVAVPEDVYLSKIVNFTEEQRDLYLSFVEPVDGASIEVTLSPLAFSLLEIESHAESPKVAQTVVEKLDTINDEKVKTDLKRCISKSASPLWRSQKQHSFARTDLTVLKPGNTPERIAGFVRDNTFHVAVAFADHKKYEKEMANYQKKDFDLAPFIEWSN